jgi:tRNA A-37 threonylcarbamoyl transferase component Bud32
VLKSGSKRFAEDLRHIMDTLDHIGILHNDGNALNLMLNDKDELRIIDFGLAKKIDKKLRKKWNNQPNIEVTMHMLIKGLRKYKINI